MNLQNLVTYSHDVINLDIFAGVTVPADIDRETLISAIMVRCGLLTPVYNDPYIFQKTTSLWFQTKQYMFEHLVNIVKAQYSPIENVDRYDEHTNSVNGNNSKNSGYTNSESGSDAKTYSGSSESTVSAFNSSAYQPDSKTTDGSSDSSNYSHSLNNTASESGTHASTETYTQHLHGNIGVTSNQQLINQELDLLAKFDIYKYIAEQFERDNMIMVY